MGRKLDDCKIVSITNDPKRKRVIVKWKIGKKLHSKDIPIGQPEELQRFRETYKIQMEKYLAGEE
jgi:hypothetical protein